MREKTQLFPCLEEGNFYYEKNRFTFNYDDGSASGEDVEVDFVNTGDLVINIDGGGGGIDPRGDGSDGTSRNDKVCAEQTFGMRNAKRQVFFKKKCS